jgi:hypothetical protein
MSEQPNPEQSNPEQPNLEQSNLKLLYIDILNFGNYFFDRTKYSWDLTVPFKKVQLFVKAMKQANFEIKIFIDEGLESEEAIDKWRSRRENEIKKEEKYMPQGMSIFLGDMFKSQGVPVYYSLEADNDDTVAAYAQKDGADILSGDGDFYRYENRTYNIYTAFNFNRLNNFGQIELIKNTESKEKYLTELKMKSSRKIIDPLPKVIDPKVNIPYIPILKKIKFYRRGVPSPLVKRLGVNPHITVRPLRRAIFNFIFDNNNEIKIFEEFPVFNIKKNDVEWDRVEVELYEKEDEQYKKMINFLKNPDEAFKYFFPVEATGLEDYEQRKKVKFPQTVSFNEWKKHAFACKSVLYEQCCIYNNNNLLSFFI